MLKENWRLVSRIERFGDAVIISLCFLAAYYGRSSLVLWDDALQIGLPFGGEVLAPISTYFVVLLLAVPIYLTTLNLMGAYGSMRMSSNWRLLWMSIVSSLIAFMMIGAFLFLFKIDLSRSFIALFCGFVALSLTAERYITLGFLRFWRRRGRNFRNVIVCGTGEQAVRIAREISQRPELGIRVRCFADLAAMQTRGTANEHEFFRDRVKTFRGVLSRRIVQGLPALQRALKEYAIDEVIFTDVIDVLPHVEEMVLICSEQGVRTTIAADLFSIGLVKSGLSYFGGMPLIHFQTPPGDRWELAVKRALDVAVSLALFILLAPLFICIALAIRFTSPGPIIFRQRRVGLNGRVFELYKFRSMLLDAEDQLAALREHNEMRGPVFKMKDDPRVTRIGKLLRRFSLDELPQFWNVLRGDMSLVGPRPPVPGEVSLYERKDRRRLSMRPGITCTWQVSGRNEISDFQSWVKLDLEYIDNWSLSRDFMLLFRTIPAVLFGTGAR